MTRRVNETLRNRARPIPDPVLLRPTIVFAPHPDDETLGCGGTIGRLVQSGVPVHLVVLTDGRGSHAHLMPADELAAIRLEEAGMAAAALGIRRSAIDLLGFEEPRLGASAPSAKEKIAAILNQHRPAQILVPYRHDPHVDHRTTSSLVAAVSRTLPEPPTIWEYPIWLWDHWPRTRAWHLTSPGRVRWLLQSPARAYRLQRDFRHRVEVGPYLDLKAAALRQHKSQTTRLRPTPRWMTLADVGEGTWLPHFFSGDEFFSQRA
jgi:LmbE family N-acetylglucosaminyl deacetylase